MNQLAPSLRKEFIAFGYWSSCNSGRLNLGFSWLGVEGREGSLGGMGGA